jgi:hypothetical protein
MVNGTMVYTGDADLVGDNIDTIEKNTWTLIDYSTVAGLEVNAEETSIRGVFKKYRTLFFPA